MIKNAVLPLNVLGIISGVCKCCIFHDDIEACTTIIQNFYDGEQISSPGH